MAVALGMCGQHDSHLLLLVLLVEGWWRAHVSDSAMSTLGRIDNTLPPTPVLFFVSPVVCVCRAMHSHTQCHHTPLQLQHRLDTAANAAATTTAATIASRSRSGRGGILRLGAAAMVVSSLPASYAFGLVAAGSGAAAAAVGGRAGAANLSRYCSSRLSALPTHGGSQSAPGGFDRSLRLSAFGVFAAGEGRTMAAGRRISRRSKAGPLPLWTSSPSSSAFYPNGGRIQGGGGGRARRRGLCSTTSDVAAASEGGGGGGSGGAAVPAAVAEKKPAKANKKKGGGGGGGGKKGGKAGGGKKKGGAPAEDTPVAELRAVRGRKRVHAPHVAVCPVQEGTWLLHSGQAVVGAVSRAVHRCHTRFCDRYITEHVAKQGVAKRGPPLLICFAWTPLLRLVVRETAMVSSSKKSQSAPLLGGILPFCGGSHPSTT